MISAAAARRQNRKHQEWSRRNAALFHDGIEQDLRDSLNAWLRDRRAGEERELVELAGGAVRIHSIDYAELFDRHDER